MGGTCVRDTLPIAGMDDEGEFVSRVIRIGPEQQGYTYTQIRKFRWYCDRGSEWGDEGTRLFLVRKLDGHWVDYDVYNIADPFGAMPVFRTSEAGKDPTVSGWYKWDWNKNRKAHPNALAEWDGRGMEFWTYDLGLA